MAKKTVKKTHLRKSAKKAAKKRRPARKTHGPALLQLYFWPTSNPVKVSVMLEECGLPYTIIPVDIGRGDQFKTEFLRISPNNRVPAIIDPDGPDGKPIAIFESGAILQYLGRKTGKFYPEDPRKRAEVEQWLFWQVAGLGPMAGQSNHFRNYAPESIPYAVRRYTNEVNRLFGVMNTRLANRRYLAGAFSIADISCIGWVNGWKRHEQNISDFPHLAAWLERMNARPGVKRGRAVGQDLRQGRSNYRDDPIAAEILFNQRAR